MGCIVELYYQLFISLLIVLLYANFLEVVLCKSNLCRSEERTALVQFKNHFSITEGYLGCTPKTSFWKEDDEDCCMWQGVSCDDMTGHVIGLDLDNTCLNGTIPLNSSLFSLVHLQELKLGNNLFANSRISPSFSNLTNLTVLILYNSEFSGIVPDEIYQLPELQTLYLSNNIGLVSELGGPNATQQSKLVQLDLSYTGFTGELPDTIDQFKSLAYLTLSGCNFSGLIPPSLGNLTKLVRINLDNNRFSGEVPSVISRLPNLTYLDLSYNNLYGHIPPFLGNLSNLWQFYVQNNDLSGPLPSQLLNLSSLGKLDVSNNLLTGAIDLNIFTNLSILNTLGLSKSGLSVKNTDFSILSALPNITSLYLSSCNVSISNLTYFDAPIELRNLDLSENNIENEIHPSICTLRSLTYLDLSDNLLSGPIPACLGMSATLLAVLKLENNNLHGTIPESIGYFSHLQVLDLSNNQLQGAIPRSLVNCTELEVLNLGHNMLADIFPFWLGSGPHLKVLILRENNFHGRMEDYFLYTALLHIVDVSGNDLIGTLPSDFFLDLTSMMYGNEGYSRSLNTDDTNGGYFYSVSITSKGQLLEYVKVSIHLKVIDFSHNKFKGKIPPSIGKLKGIKVLNFSGNMLNGTIPSSLGDLTNLESLDLSRNKLSGKVPQELASLSFLAFLNVSHNNLTGLIPQGGQLYTFSSTSYEGNPGLCGPPLQNLCNNFTTQTPKAAPTLKNSQHFKFELNGFGWEEVLIGYVCGLVFGLVIGCIFIKEECIKRLFRVKMRWHGRYGS